MGHKVFEYYSFNKSWRLIYLCHSETNYTTNQQCGDKRGTELIKYHGCFKSKHKSDDGTPCVMMIDKLIGISTKSPPPLPPRGTPPHALFSFPP